MALPADPRRAELDFEALYGSTRDDLFAYAAGLLRDRSPAEEVVAQSYERAYRRRRSFDPRRGSGRAWLFGIARNSALDELRRRKRIAALAADAEDVTAGAHEDAAEGVLSRAALRRALAGLPARDRELVALKFFAGLSNAEIGRVPGVSESNAGTLLHRSVQKLRKALHATHSPEPSPEAARDLQAIDATLGGRPVDAGQAELAELVRALREERPAIDPAFAQRLDRELAARAGRAPAGPFARLRAFVPARLPLPALGAAATALIVLVIALPLALRDDGGGTQPVVLDPGKRGATEQAAPETASAGSDRKAAPGIIEPLPPSGDAILPRVRNRAVERSASLVLTAPSDRIADVADDVIRVTDEVGGIVLTSSVDTGDGATGTARFDLRVPTARLKLALRGLSRLAHVRSRTESGNDITAPVLATRERLRESLAERSSLLRQLGRARTPNETAAIRARLRIANGEISSIRGEARRLRERTDLSSVAVSIEAGARADSGGGGAWTPRDALDDAQRILEVAAGAALIAAAIVLPALALGALALFGLRATRRRRHDAALGER